MEMDEERLKREFDLFYGAISLYTDIYDKSILDLCASWGNHTGFLEDAGGKVLAIDIANYYSYFRNNPRPPYQFSRMDAQKLGIRSASIDVVFCINAFEHIPNPELTLQEIYRVLKPNGYAFISFIPCYYSDVGSHMAQFIQEPWAHLIYNEDEYIRKLSLATSGDEYWVDEFKNALNRKSKKYFIELFDKYTFSNWLQYIIHRSHFETLIRHEWIGVDKIVHLDHPNFKILKDIYSEDELLFRGMYLLLRKPTCFKNRLFSGIHKK